VVAAPLLWLALASSDPSKVRVAVLPIIVAPDNVPTVSEVFKQVTDAALLRPTLAVMSIDDYYFNEGGELATRALACGSDVACIAERLVPFNADVGVIVVANLEIDPPFVSVLLVDTTRKVTIVEESGDVSGRAAVLSSIFERTSRAYDRAGHPRSGRLIVSVEPGRAALAIEGRDAKPDIGQSNAFTLPPGEYQVLGSADGFVPGRVPATVKSGETVTVALALEEDTSIFESPWFWIISGAVVVAGGATAAGLLLSKTEECLCVITADQRECTVCR
jgi:hypothetical protein